MRGVYWCLVVIGLVIFLYVVSKRATEHRIRYAQITHAEKTNIEDLRTGDVLVFMSVDSSDIENYFLHPNLYTHVGIIYQTIGGIYVVEVDPCQYGVKFNPLSKVVADYCGNVLVCHMRGSHQMREEISREIERVIHRIGKGDGKYRSLWEMLGIGIESVGCLFDVEHQNIRWCTSLVYHILSETKVIPKVRQGYCIEPDQLVSLILQERYERPRLIKKVSLEDSCIPLDRPTFELCNGKLHI